MASRYIQLDELVAYGPVNKTDDNSNKTLQWSIDRAEAQIDEHCGVAFDEADIVDEVPQKAWIDATGWLWIVAAAHGPISAVTSVKVRDLLGAPATWSTLSFDPVNDVLLYPVTTPPKPQNYVVRLTPTNPTYGARSTDQILVKWSYTGGYPAIPEALKAIALRLAWWNYKLREAPLGRVVDANLRLMEVPMSIPPDIRADLNSWRRAAV